MSNYNTLAEKITHTHDLVVQMNLKLAIQNERLKSQSLWVTFHTGIFVALFINSLVGIAQAN